MLEHFAPDEYVGSIFEIDLDRLSDMGIGGLIIDIDNTLVGWKTKTADHRILEWFEVLKIKGFKACILSNNTKDRVVKFTEQIRIPAVYRAAKPRKKAFERAMDLMGTGPADTAVLGDQIFTDVFGGKRLGLYTVLVKPLAEKEFITTRLVRRIERIVINRLIRQGKLTLPNVK
jgi:HAD superfamily phosphatase (TIGR01668 family)